MSVESASYVSGLEPTNPPNSDPVRQGSDHLRLLKTVLKASFPNISGAVTATHTELSGLPARATALEATRARKDVSDTFAALMAFTTGLNAASIQRGGAELVPVGSVVMWLNGAAPSGYLKLDGAEVSRTTYAALFALYGTLHGAGDGSTTFNLPDLRLRFPVMAGTGLPMLATGGTTTPTVTIASSGAHDHTGTALTAGSHSHGGAVGATTLSLSQIPAHTHAGVTGSDGSHTHNAGVYSGSGGDATFAYTSGTTFQGTAITASNGAHTHAFTTDSQGGGGSHNHTILTDGTHAHTLSVDNGGAHAHTGTVGDGRPPYFALNFIVRAL